MFFYPTATKTGRKRQRGSAALAAIIALGVVFTVSIGLLTLGDAVDASGKRQLRGRGARALAEAGVEYGYWEYAFNGRALPYSATRTLGDGRFSTTVSFHYASIPNTLRIVSTGTMKGETYRVTRVMKELGVFDYALCVNSAVSNPQRLVTGANGAGGRIRINGNVSLTNSLSAVNGNVTARGSISIPTITGSQTPNAPPVTFPIPDFNYYESIANRKFSGDWTFAGFTFQVPNEVVYVSGNMVLDPGTISGTGTLVARGRIKFRGNISYALSTDKLAGLAGNGFDTEVSSTVVGIYYGHNSNNNCNANISRNLTISRGSFACSTFNIGANGSFTSTRDPDMTATLGKQLRLPGY